MNETDLKVHPLEAAGKMQALMNAYIRKLGEAKQTGQKICWATGSAPMDMMLAMDIFPAYPENHATMCGASHIGTKMCEVAEEHGYSQDLCSYARNCLGSCLIEDKDLKVAPLPAPDIIFAATMCTTHVKWWEALGRHYGIPVLILETPFMHDSLTADDARMAVRYVEDQLRDTIAFLEGFCGRKFDYDRMQECVSNSARTAQLYARFVNMARHKPSPVSSFDTFVHLAPLMAMRGFPEPIAYYEQLLQEVNERVKNGVSAVGRESYRLYWDNIPVWYRLGWLGRKLAGYGACAVASTYPFAWIDCFAGLDSKKPIETTAEGQAFFYLNKGTRQRIEFLLQLTRDFAVDGLLAQVSVSCKAFVPDQAVIIKEAQKAAGVPAVMIEGDMVDERSFSEVKVSQQIETFIGVLASSPRSR